MQRALLVTILAAAACGDNLRATPDADPSASDGGPGDADPGPDAQPIVYPPGALVSVTAGGTVGILLDDFPATSRDRLATVFLALTPDYWVERAKQQVRLATYRLVYREFFYPENDNRNALPLTQPEAWTITLDGAGAYRGTVDGHDLVMIDYTMTTTILTDEASPAESEPDLATVGGTFTESFVFPIDPTMLVQRTGYACMDEEDFPTESVDEENAWEFFDDDCMGGNNWCHITEPIPNRSCQNAIRQEIGRVDVDVTFERLAFDEATAAAVRSGQVTTQDTPDLSVVTEGYLGLENNRVIYRYFADDHCAMADACITGTGWRRLLTFDSYDHNVGGAPLHIGEVDYLVEGLGSELIDHNVYVLSPCHNHYHFEYYGDFSYGPADVHKNGFCLESTGRISNNELSPLHTEYHCDYQGVTPGWGDLYAAGLTCNWVDVTDIDTSGGPVTHELTFASNPDGFLCEGTLEVDGNGDQVWEPTAFTTSTGDPVDRPACDETPGTDANDVGSIDVTLPQRGGMLSSACTDPHTLGPRRNCGFTEQATALTCTAGATIDVQCTGGSATQPQVVRLCETSQALGGGVECVHRDALANIVVEGTAVTAEITCPAARDATEVGGEVAVYTAPVFAPDGASTITCTVL